MDAPLETELKFRAESDAPLDALAAQASLGEAALGPAREVDEVDRYLDTADLRLAGARWACRLRTRDGRTIVSLKGAPIHPIGDALHQRPELEGPAGEATDPHGWPPSPARELVLSLSADGHLDVRITLAQHRTERMVSVGGRTVGLLSLDRVRVVHRGTEVGRLHVVELELEPSAVARGFDPTPLAATLVEWPGLVPDPASKLEHALALIDEGPG
jgi:inorganic triphosphatase YgiF